ncbi:MAG TPA: hypothetical protein DEO60_15270 [Bacteroidales bacterium]|jgi:tetratricopeptide (TPR) repeat protein|nr:hypothetical protein [Bacteroidales bacterium]HBZ22491.1 hypothetical protein [Bacteroidales bacterium]
MPFDLFVSYSRSDDHQGRITQLIERIKTDFKMFAGRPLGVFFDVEEIHGMEDWRHRILQGLHESRLLLACLSPSYVQSDYCEWEFNEYLKNEIDKAYFGDGVAPIYFIEVPGWEDKDFEKKSTAWLIELRRRQHFDLRPWFNKGEESLRDVTIKERIAKLNIQIKERIVRFERTEFKLGNIDAHNPHFIGRTSELRRLREIVAFGKVGVLTAIHGLGGIGKTALAIEYAHVFSHEYGGGCWQVHCEGKADLLDAIAGLAAPLALEFNEEESKSIDLQFQRVLAELHNLACKHAPNRCLLLLDNVDNPKILEPIQTKHLPASDWLHILVTTRLGEPDLYGTHIDRAFIPVDEMPENDALELIKSYQLGGVFSSASEQDAAFEIIKILDRFTLAVEMTAVYLGQYAKEVTCSGFLTRLKSEGFAGIDRAAKQTTERLRHGEKCLVATLNSTLEHLKDPERLALIYAALLPADQIALPWIRTLVTETYPEFGKDSEPGYPDLWETLLRHLLSFRLLQVTNLIAGSGHPVNVKMHRIVGQTMLTLASNDTISYLTIILKLGGLIYERSFELSLRPVDKNYIWELDCLFRSIQNWIINNRYLAQASGILCCSTLRDYGRYRVSQELAEMLIETINKGNTEPGISIIWCHNMAGIAALDMDDSVMAEYHFFFAKKLIENSSIDDLDRLDTLTNISCLYRRKNRPDLAIDHSKVALKISEVKFGKDSPETSIRCVNLGLVLQDLCNLKEAIYLFHRAVNIDMNHPDLSQNTCMDLSTLAEALRNNEQIEEAEKTIRKAFEIASEKGYNQHPLMMNIMINYAFILAEQNNFYEAERLLFSACEIASQFFGKTSSNYSLCLNNIGVLSMLKGDLHNALDKFQDSLRIEIDQKNPDKQKLAYRELNIGIAYLLDGNPVESLSHLHSGWNHKVRLGRHDLLTARLLLTRLAASFLLKESNDLFVGQLKTLNDEDILMASGINIKWSMAEAIKSIINTLPAEQIHLWNSSCKFENLKIEIDSSFELKDAVQIKKLNLNEEWPKPYLFY